jgi:hypothetical protein
MAKQKGRPAKQLSLEGFAGTIVMPTVYTMALAGIWHGAGLQFLVFGLMHAFYLCVAHAWRNYGPKAPAEPRPAPVRAVITTSQILLTYLCVLAAQIFFRAGSVGDAVSMLSGMVGQHGFDPPHVGHAVVAKLGSIGAALVRNGWISEQAKESWPPHDFGAIFLRFLIVFFLPNTQQIMARFQPYLAKVEPFRWLPVLWGPQAWWAAATAALLTLDIISMRNSTVFLYFQF